MAAEKSIIPDYADELLAKIDHAKQQPKSPQQTGEQILRIANKLMRRAEILDRSMELDDSDGLVFHVARSKNGRAETLLLILQDYNESDTMFNNNITINRDGSVSIGWEDPPEEREEGLSAWSYRQELSLQRTKKFGRQASIDLKVNRFNVHGLAMSGFKADSESVSRATKVLGAIRGALPLVEPTEGPS